MVIEGIHTFMANLAKDKWNPPRMEYATLQVRADHIVITNRSGDNLRLDMDAAQALAMVLKATVLA